MVKKVILFVLCCFMLLSCPPGEPILEPDPDQLEPPVIEGSGPILTLGDEVSFSCGFDITPEVIAVELQKASVLTINTDNENHSGSFVIKVEEFVIPQGFHGFYENINFSVRDSTGKVTNDTFTVFIAKDSIPGAVDLNYIAGIEVEFSYGINPKTCINEILRTIGSGISVANTNSCAHSEEYTIVDEVGFPPNVGGFRFFMTPDLYDVTFTVADSLGQNSSPVTIKMRIPSPIFPPDVVVPASVLALAKNVNDSVTDTELFTHLEAIGTIISRDPNVSWGNVTFQPLTLVDSTKQGVQKIFFTVTDSNGNVSEVSEANFIKIDFTYLLVGTPVFTNILQDPGFELPSAAMVGTSTNVAYDTARLSEHWTITPYTLHLNTAYRADNKILSGYSTSPSDNIGDLDHGPIILKTDHTLFAGATMLDDGYNYMAAITGMEPLQALSTLNHMLVYRGSEMKKSGTYSFALRGKQYQPGNSIFFWGVGAAIYQEVTLQANYQYNFGAEVLQWFGGGLDGMTGAIYITVKKQADNTIIKEVEIFKDSTSVAAFKLYEGESFIIRDETPAIFEIRRYLSNDSGGKNEINSTWHYSPIYIDDTKLEGTPVPAFHPAEVDQLPPQIYGVLL